MTGIILFAIFVLYWLSQSGQSSRLGEHTRWLPPDYDPRLVALDAGVAEWKERVLTFCESPAEIAFLEAMIVAYGLTPRGSWLKGGGLSLTLQTKLPPYRVDFLADEWLVIEIDGAAYHSSQEAIAADKTRDAFLLDKGYSTIRIPAKIVFNDAAQAVQRVRTAITSGPPEGVRRIREAAEAERTRRAKENAAAPRSLVRRGFAWMKQFFEDVGGGIWGIDAMNDAVKAARERERERSLTAPEEEATARHTALVNETILDLQHREYIAQDPTGARAKQLETVQALLKPLIDKEFVALEAERGRRTKPENDEPSAESRQAGEVAQALAASHHVVATEEALITIALKRAELEVRLPELEQLKKNMERFPGLTPSEGDRSKMSSLAWRDGRYERPCKGGYVLTISVPSVPPAPTHADPATHERIGRGYRALLDRREKFLDDARRRVHSHPLLPGLIRGELGRFGAEACWESISQPLSERSIARARG